MGIHVIIFLMIVGSSMYFSVSVILMLQLIAIDIINDLF